jgi:regulatory protein
VEIQTALAHRCIVERFAHRREIGKAARQCVEGGGRDQKRFHRQFTSGIAHARNNDPLPLSQRLWHNFDSMAQERQPQRRERRAAKPLAAGSLRALALAYVGKYATSSGKLTFYLTRKLRERGWEGDVPPPVADIVDDFVRLGFIDDQGFAAARQSALLRRGYGANRIRSALRHDGVGAALAESAGAIDEDIARQSAMDFARRKRLGPFAGGGPVEPKALKRAIAAMARAGHDYGLIREILFAEPESAAS